MEEWIAAVVATALFIFLSPGLVFQVPGNNHSVDFGKMETSVSSILLHAFLYFGLVAVITIVIPF